MATPPDTEAAAARTETAAARTETAAARTLFAIGVALIGAAAVSGFIEPLATLARHVPLDPNEGWNALFGQIAMRGGELYPAPGSAIVNNYPPLSFYIVGAVGRAIGDNIFAGRAVALVSMLVVIANVYLWLRATGSPVRIAVLGAAVLAAFAVTYARPYAAMDDPQWLAHAFMTSGAVIVWRGNASQRALALGALLMLLGGWTKHLLIPLPIATTWWLMGRSRAALTAWLAWAVSLLALISLAVWLTYGNAFFENMNLAREYSLHQANSATRRALQSFAPILGLSLALLPLARRGDRNSFAAAYVIAAAVVAVTASGGIGVDINAFFDLMIAASLGAALAVDALRVRCPPGTLGAIPVAAVVTLLLGVDLAWGAAASMPEQLRDLRGLDGLERQTAAATTLIAQKGGGRAACESPELCYWAKNPFVLDFFNYGQRLKLGKVPLSSCLSVLDGRHIPLLQLDPNKGRGGSFQLPDACNAAIAQNYRIISTSRVGVILEATAAADQR